MIGAGAVLGQFTAKLGLDSTSYTRGIINAEGMNRVFGQSFTQFVTNPLLGSIEILKNVTVGVGRAVMKHAELAETLQRTAQATGMGEQALIAMAKRLEVAGYTGDIAAKAMATLGKNILELHSKGSGPLKDVTDLLGVQVNASSDLEITLVNLLDQINRLPTAYQRSAAAGKVFGEEAGPKLLNAIGGGSAAFREMIEEVRQLGFRVDATGNDGIAGFNTQLGYMKQAVEGIKFNALQSFLVGLTGASDGSTKGIRELADTVNNSLGPALRDLGENVAPFLGVVSDNMPGINSQVRELLDTLSAVAELWEGSWLEKARTFLVDAAATDIRLTHFQPQLTPGQQRLDQMSPISRRRNEWSDGPVHYGF